MLYEVITSSVLALYSYDDNPEDQSAVKEMQNAISIIARMPSIMVYAYQVKKRYYDKKSLVMHHVRDNESTAEAILSALRNDRKFTREEARLLDLRNNFV